MEMPDLNQFRSVEELTEHRKECEGRLKELDAEFKGLPFTEEARGEFADMTDRVEEIDRRINELEARRKIMERKFREGTAVVEPPPEEDRGRLQTPGTRTPDNPYALEEYRSLASSVDQLPSLWKDGARRILEQVRYPSERTNKEATGDHVERLLDRDASGEFARRVIATANPLYDRAFGKYVIGGGIDALNNEERKVLTVTRAMSLTDSAGGFAVPFTLDATLILTEDIAVSPLRRISRNITITNQEWRGVTADGVDVTYEAELTQVAASQPVLTQPTIIPEKAQGYTEFSIEVDSDWGALRGELGRAFAEAKAAKEADKFLNGLGHASSEPEGLLVGATNIVATNASNAFVIGDLFDLVNALPERYQDNATIVGNRAVFGLIRQFDTTGGAAYWANLGESTPSRLLEYPAAPISGLDSAVAAGNNILIIGDFSKFVIVDRAGLNVELVPHVFGANHRPTGARALYIYFRNSSGVVDAKAFRVLTVATA